MIRGTQKNMIVIKPPVTSPFESAWFVLRRVGKESPPPEKGAMVREAHRILSESATQHRRKIFPKDRLASMLLVFLSGILCGALTVGILWFCL